MLNVCRVDEQGERGSPGVPGESGVMGAVSPRRRFLHGLGVIAAASLLMIVYTERVVGKGGALVYGSLTLVALCAYVLFHRREPRGARTGGSDGRRGMSGWGVVTLISAAGLTGFGIHAFRSGAGDVARVALSLSALAFIGWARTGKGIGRRTDHKQRSSNERRRTDEPYPLAPLPIAQVDFLWSLSALVLCGFLVLFMMVGPDLTRPGPIIGLGCFVLLGLGLYGRLMLLTWPVLATPDGSRLLKGALFSSGVFIVGLGTASYMIFGSASGLFSTVGAAIPMAELAPAAPARSTWSEAATWERLPPGTTDLIELGESDLNATAGGSVYERVADAVVTIRAADGHGTGFLITKDGLAITNDHVVDNAGPLVAVFRDGSERPVRVLRRSSTPDVALVQIACSGDCATVTLAAETEPRVGTEILVIGTPKAEILHHSMTRGIISGLRYDLGSTAIQTDAAISSGNSGSPILHAASGRVIGMITSSLRGQDTEGVHFGIAVRDALRALGIRVRSS